MFAWPKGGRWTSGKVEISEAKLMGINGRELLIWLAGERARRILTALAQNESAVDVEIEAEDGEVFGGPVEAQETEQTSYGYRIYTKTVKRRYGEFGRLALYGCQINTITQLRGEGWQATLLAGGGAITSTRLAMIGEKIEVKK
jgi:hypothetical protein